MAERIFDSIILGGGPAGLSAAVYLGRFLRRVVVIDSDSGRSTGPQLNENYLGFPKGIKASRLRELGRRQAERFGAEFVQGSIHTGVREKDSFLLTGDCGEWRGRSVIIATGVTDIWPGFPYVHRYIGRSLFWCITCDGHRTRDQRTLLIGAEDEAVTTACQFLRFTKKLTFAATGAGDGTGVSPAGLEQLKENGIAVVEGVVERVTGSGGQVTRAFINGQLIETDLIFSLLGSVPNSSLAAQLGVILDKRGSICIDDEQRTNVPNVYAAGDVTGSYAHQVTSAVHEGATAAQTANYELYEDFQKDDEEE